MTETSKAETHGYEPTSNSSTDPSEIYAIQVPKDSNLEAAWVRVTRSKFVSHPGLSASGTLEEVRMAIADYEGVPVESVAKTSAYDNKLSVRVEAFGFQFPASQFSSALDFTQKTGQSVSLKSDPKDEDVGGSYHRLDRTLKGIRKLTKRKLKSIGWHQMTVDDQWILEDGRLSYDPDLARKKYAAKVSHISSRRQRGTSGIRRCRIDHNVLWCMFQICMEAIKKSEIFRSSQGYYYCRPPFMEESPSSREGHTIGIWKMARLIVKLFGNPTYRAGSYSNSLHRRTWWDCIQELNEKNMKDACMRDEFRYFVEKEIRVMKRLRKGGPKIDPKSKPEGKKKGNPKAAPVAANQGNH